MLNDLDKELTRRGHRFCRYADDCRQRRQGLLPRKRRHRHSRFELRAVLLPLYAHFSRPFWTGQPLAYPAVQNSGAVAVCD
jgi:hypothetical protein